MTPQHTQANIQKGSDSGMPDTSENGKYITYEELDDGAIVRILLNRERTRNAQNRGLLVELDEAFLRAEEDDKVRVVILGGVGPLVSSGHDMGSKESQAERAPGPDQHPSMTINGATREGAESRMLQEWHYYFQNTLRWRNLRKITVAQVQGTVYAAGLMLMWACDLIVAADDVGEEHVVGGDDEVAGPHQHEAGGVDRPLHLGHGDLAEVAPPQCVLEVVVPLLEHPALGTFACRPVDLHRAVS